MATVVRRAAIVATTPRRGAVVSRAKFNDLAERSKKAAKRLREASSEDQDALLSVGTGLALGLYERSGRKLPTVMGFDPAVAWGVGVYALTRQAKGKSARMARDAAIALATIGANRSIMRGSVKVAGDDDSDEDDI